MRENLKQCHNQIGENLAERARLLNRQDHSYIAEDEPIASFTGLNALAITAVAHVRKFLSQQNVQKLVDDIWNGHIIFWESLTVHSKKKAKAYNKYRAYPYCMLRGHVLRSISYHYAVLAERNPDRITPAGILHYIWIAAFAYDGFG